MNKMIMFFGLLSLSSMAFAASTQVVDCKSEIRAGGALVTINGKLSLTKHPTYPAPAKLAFGNLAIKIANGRGVILKSTEVVNGQYDDVNDTEYATLGSAKVMVYINLSEKDQSYVEYKGKSYPTNCAK